MDKIVEEMTEQSLEEVQNVKELRNIINKANLLLLRVEKEHCKSKLELLTLEEVETISAFIDNLLQEAL